MTLPNADVTTRNLEILGARHPSVRDVARFLVALPEDVVAADVGPDLLAYQFRALALQLLEQLPDSAELTVTLRKLLEARDSMHRAAVPPMDGKAG